MEVFMGSIQNFAFSYAPQGWAQCQGQLMTISQSQALFALLSTTFGGDGRTNFGLPDLRGRVMMGQGQQSGGSNYLMGQPGGAETAALQTTNLPPHAHTLNASSGQATQAGPAGTMLPATAGGTDSSGGDCTIRIYGPAGTAAPLDPSSIGSTGSGTKFGILPPYQVLNPCIAIQGLWPQRS